MSDSIVIHYDENLSDVEKALLTAHEPTLRSALTDHSIHGSMQWIAKVTDSNRAVLVLEKVDRTPALVTYYVQSEIENPRTLEVVRGDLGSRQECRALLRRRIVGEGNLEGVSLVVTFRGVDWKMALRRRLQNPDQNLANLNGKAITARIVEWFIPHWKSLQWNSRTTLHSVRDAAAEVEDLAQLVGADGDYEVELTGKMPETSESTILSGWREFMSQTTDVPYAGQLG